MAYRKISRAWPVTAAICGLAACDDVGSSVEVTSQATGSAYFNLGPPTVYKAGEALRVVGRVCRRARATQLSPAGDRVEHIGSDGQTLDVAHASLAAIYPKRGSGLQKLSRARKLAAGPGREPSRLL